MFVLLVALPTIAAGIYYWGVASPQYVAEIRLGVRSADAQRNDGSAIFQGMASASQIGLQSNVMVQYIQSREIVDLVNRKIDLRGIYSRPDADTLARIASVGSVEDLVEYWKGKVEPYFDLTTGIITVRVRAFAPEDARAIGQEIVVLSEALVNDLSRRAREDFVRFAREQVATADGRLREARQAVLEFRNKEQSLDPRKEADAQLLAISKLKDELAKTNTEMLSARPLFSPDSSRMVSLRLRVQALGEQIREAEARLTASGVDPGARAALSRDISGYETLETERLLAEKYYESALQSLQRAQFEAARQTMYLEVFVRPALAERALYPRRTVSVLVAALVALGVWLFVLMTVHAIREHA